MEELRSRPWRPPDHTKENSTLVALVTALADSPLTILQTLVDKVLEVLRADSAGLSLLTKDEKRFYWAAIAGAWRPHIGGCTPRDFGPCGDVLDHNVPMLFTHWERRYPYLSMAVPLAEEGLLVPFYVNGKAVGTIWAIAHNNRRQFDAEDLRLLESMGRFASAAYQTVESIENLKLQIAAREEAEIALRELANGLEAKVRRLVDSNIIGIFIWGLNGRITDANEAFLRIVGYSRDDLVSIRFRWTERTRPEGLYRDERQWVPRLKTTGSFQPFWRRSFRIGRSGGSARDPARPDPVHAGLRSVARRAGRTRARQPRRHHGAAHGLNCPRSEPTHRRDAHQRPGGAALSHSSRTGAGRGEGGACFDR